MMDGFEEKETHPSYAMLSFSRVQSSGSVSLFGSDLTHSTYIRMRLSTAEKVRGLSRNWYHTRGLIAEVDMSQNQFAELVTSMNMGEGIPVTLSMTEKDGRIEPPSCDAITKLHEKEFKQTAKDVADSAFQLQERLREMSKQTGTLKKADREALLKHAEAVVRDITANMPYMAECFAESMDKVVTDAKGTIEAFYQHRVVEAGLDALTNGTAPKLIEVEK